ncbi:hypothetical protein LTR37_014655 [Vermiconidia calcicola]|uniref:Uncharacterized protein n=1 Tax=Vermiconidia calcicola TaxID=1690605 RepID=A0ACC3MT64_9PEZI|nr:hypothetical protein LTR37_014655 [Vermiconidia calcicola]
MINFANLLPIAFLTLTACVSQVKGLGCYDDGLLDNSDFKYSRLHGASRDTYDEVRNDINRFCNLMDGRTFRGDERFTDCSTWEVYDFEEYSHINWEVSLYSGQGDWTIRPDYCISALNWELDHCSNGSEQEHGGFLFKMDPNPEAC